MKFCLVLHDKLKTWSRIALLLAVGPLQSSAQAQGTLLYAAEFESPTFTAGNTALTAKDGWVVSAVGYSASISALQPVYGVDPAIVPGLGQTAFIGFNNPTFGTTSALYSAFRPTPFTPPLTGNSGSPILKFSATIGLTKSKDTLALYNDTFKIGIYNNGSLNDGNGRSPLGTIEFPTYLSNATTNGTIQRGDGAGTAEDTGVLMIYGEALELIVVVNFQTNRWTASLGGSPLFVDAVFLDPALVSTRPRTLGMVAAQWAPFTPSRPGNNWMLFDDWNISMQPLQQQSIEKIELAATGIKLSWPVELGYVYRLETSTQLSPTSNWQKTLLGSLFTPTQSASNFSFIDPSPVTGRKFYRIRRGLPGSGI
jgi:hypothetical protein